MPIALLPPPTQATTTSGCLPSASPVMPCAASMAGICSMHSSPITLWKSRTMVG